MIWWRCFDSLSFAGGFIVGVVAGPILLVIGLALGDIWRRR